MSREEYRPKILTTIKEVQNWRLACTLAGKSVGLIPTMGALHLGHLSLINESLNNNDLTIVSIFVNPSQFAPNEDLSTYPRTLDSDISAVSELSGKFNKLMTRVDVVFTPQVSEMYPSGIPLELSEQKGAFVLVLGLSEMLEGKSRPTFFRGVATVVAKLFIVINPSRAYFGEKDIQQTLVIKRMVHDLLFDIDIVVCKIWREESGLALSSRNKYMDENTKRVSSSIYQMLEHAKKLYLQNVRSVAILQQEMHKVIQPNIDSGKMKIDYISVNDKLDLHDITQEIDSTKGAVISCAIWVKNDGDQSAITTRLIDNVVL